MDFYLALASGWVILGNIWHAFLISQNKRGVRPLTISEHAVGSPQLLLIHRIVHTLPILLFTPLALGYLLPSGYYAAGIFLMAAAIFDSAETLTLNQRTASIEASINTHKLTAWVMALSYFGYALMISQIANTSPWIYGSTLLACIGLLIIAILGWFKRRTLEMQMAYFVLVSFIGLVAHIKLIAR